MQGSTESALILRLDDQVQEALENLAAEQRCSLEECAQGLLRRVLREKISRKVKPSPIQHAPLDDFLPEGADPFAPVHWEGSGRHGASSFADVQTRMRFAGTPALLRDFEE